MYGFQCDRCEYVTQSEDDHIVTDEGEYLCIPCYKKLEKEKEKEDDRLIQPCPR